MHGIRSLVPRTEARMTLASDLGEPIDYVRRHTHMGVVEGRTTPMALYAPESINDMEFDVLAAHAIREENARH